MPIERINPPGVMKHPNYTRVITVTGPMKLIFIAGQLAQNEDLSCVAPGDFRAQYLFVMEKLEILLAAAGATWSDVMHRRNFITDFDAYQKIRQDRTLPQFWNPDALPCSTGIGVTRLAHPDCMIEIDLIAALSQ